MEYDNKKTFKRNRQGCFCIDISDMGKDNIIYLTFTIKNGIIDQNLNYFFNTKYIDDLKPIKLDRDISPTDIKIKLLKKYISMK